MQENTQKQNNQLLQSFQNLEKLMVAKIGLSDVTPVRTTPIGRPPPPALPNKFDGNHSQGQAFLTVRALIDSNPKGRDVGQLRTKGC